MYMYITKQTIDGYFFFHYNIGTSLAERRRYVVEERTAASVFSKTLTLTSRRPA